MEIYFILPRLWPSTLFKHALIMGSNLRLFDKDNVSATMCHMHTAVRCESAELLVTPHDNHVTTLLLTVAKIQ
jgi:hypothetical protein